MSRQTPRVRREQFERCIPEALEHKTLLYIGANVKRMQMVECFWKAGYEIDVVEIWPKNTEALRLWNEEKKIFRNIYQADIGKFVQVSQNKLISFFRSAIYGIFQIIFPLINKPAMPMIPNKYDVVIWWHGPEHVKIRKLRAILIRLEWFAHYFVILASPWGKVSQRAIGGNKFEKHVSALYQEFYSTYGYQSDTIGEIDGADSNLLAWKKLK